MDDLSPDSALPPAGSAQDNDAPRQLVVCIDGTSNRFGDQPTNVVRLYRSLSRDPRRVLAYYDQGVGTFGLKETLFEWQKFPSRIAGLAFGWGLKRNVEGRAQDARGDITRLLWRGLKQQESYSYIFLRRLPGAVAAAGSGPVSTIANR